MLFFGYLSLIQISFLPGLIILGFFDFKINSIKTLIYSFGLSLVINHTLVLVFTALQIYNHTNFLILFLIEITILIFILVKSDKEKRHKYLIKPIISGLFIVFCLTLLFSFVPSQYTIMDGTDTLFSWNKWAVEWAGNKFPVKTWHYPQLLPTNWSLTYQFIENCEVETFAKTIMLLFYFSILIIGFSFIKNFSKINNTLKYISYFIFVIITLAGYPFFLKGLVDIPVSFFCFLSLVTLIKSVSSVEKNISIDYFILSCIFLSGALISKQSSVFFAALYPVIALILIRDNSNFTFKEICKFAILFVSIILVFVIPWYLYNELTVIKGANSYVGTEKFLQGGFFRDKGIFDRILIALKSIKSTFKFPGAILILFIVSLFSLKDKIFRWIYLLIIIPYFLLWAIFASYDLRNFSIGLTLWALSIGLGLHEIYFIIKNVFYIRGKENSTTLSSSNSMVKRLEVSYLILNNKFIVIILVFAFLLFNFILDSSYYINKQRNIEKKYIGGCHDLNKLIYTYHEKSNISKYIISNYRFIQYFPDLKSIIDVRGVIDGDIPHAMLDFNKFKELISKQNVGYILLVRKSWWANYISNEVKKWIEDKISTNQYKVVVQNDEGYLVKIK